MKKIVALLLSVLMLTGSSLMAVSCSSKKDTKSGKDDETEFTGNPDMEGTIDGVWVDESGVFMSIDLENEVIVDSCGWEFDIEQINDDGIVLKWVSIKDHSFTYEVNPRNSIFYSLPLYEIFYFPMTLKDDTLTFGDVTLYKSTSSEGKKYSNLERPDKDIDYIMWDRHEREMSIVKLSSKSDLDKYAPSDATCDVYFKDGMAAITTDEYCDHIYGDVVDFVRVDSVLGQMMLYRDSVVSGKTNDIYNFPGLSYEDNDVVVTIDYENDKGEWIPDIFDVRYYSLKDRDNLDYDEFAESVGPEANVFASGDDVDYRITITVPTNKVEEPDGVTIYDTFSYGSGGHHSIEPVSKKVENGVVTIVLEGGSGIGFCVGYDTRPTSYYELNDSEFILNTNPEDSLWAATCETGDIIDLVDMDYLKESIYDENGSAIFWVSTPEQLATVNYYVNSLDVLSDNIETMYYVHLLNDIDLAGYNWVPMGNRENERDFEDGYAGHVFQGAIFGNGYAIKNMNITGYYGKGFLSSCHLTTVCGLTLENPVIDGTGRDCSYVLIDNLSCISDVFDCKVIIDSVYEDTYEFSDSSNGSLVYFDCAFESIDSETGAVTDIGLVGDYVHEFYNGYDNWIMRYYKDEATGEYSYDAKSEYEDFLSNPESFYDCSYYYSDGEVPGEPHVGYLDFTGWMYEGEFMVNYGNIRDKYN